jgi:hypothetical protein
MRGILAVLVSAAALAAAPGVGFAAPTVTITPNCDATPTAPYEVSVVLTGLPPGALFEGTITTASGGLGPAFLRTDENGEFRIGFGGARPLGLVTASGFHDADEDFTRDPGEPTFEATLADPCLQLPVPGGSVSGAADVRLFDIFGVTPVRLSIDARSGPAGQNPSGTVRIATPSGEVLGAVTCVSVRGALATIGVRLQQALPGGISAALIDVADYSSQPGLGLEDLVALTPVATAPSECPSPLVASGFSQTQNGTFVVAPAPPLPISTEQCKNGGWRQYGIFKNQGDCVSFVATEGKNPPGKKPG